MDQKKDWLRGGNAEGEQLSSLFSDRSWLKGEGEHQVDASRRSAVEEAALLPNKPTEETRKTSSKANPINSPELEAFGRRLETAHMTAVAAGDTTTAELLKPDMMFDSKKRQQILEAPGHAMERDRLNYENARRIVNSTPTTEQLQQQAAELAAEDGGLAAHHFEDLRSNVDLEAARRARRTVADYAARQYYGTLPNAKDFEEYAARGASIENPTHEEAEGWAKIGSWRPGSKPVQNIVTYSKENAGKIQMQVGLNGTSDYVGDLIYTNMTDDEVNRYNYLLAKEGKDAAQKYLDYLDDTLQRRAGTKLAQGVLDEQNGLIGMLQSGFVGTAAGFGQIADDVKNIPAFITASENVTKPNATQYAAGMISGEKRGTGMGAAMDLSQSLMHATPELLVNAFVSPAAGGVLKGLSAASSAYVEKVRSGENPETARRYAALVGIGSSLTSAMFNGVTGHFGVNPTQLKAKIAQMPDVYGRLALNPIVDLAFGVSESGAQKAIKSGLEYAYFGVPFGSNWKNDTYDIFIDGFVNVLANAPTDLKGVATDIATMRRMTQSDPYVIMDRMTQPGAYAQAPVGTVYGMPAAEYDAKVERLTDRYMR